MAEKRSLFINKIILWFLIIFIGVTPLFFLPFTSEFYEFNKNALLFSSVFILLILWAVKMVVTKELSIKKTSFDLPILAIAVAFILSTIIVSPNKWETLWLPNGTGTVITLTFLYFIITNNVSRENRIKLLNSFIVGAVVLSLTAIFQFIGLGEAFIPEGSRVAFLRLKSWTPAGTPLVLTTFLIAVLILALTRFISIIKKVKRESLLSLIHHPISIIIILGGLGISLWQILVVSKPLLLPYSTSWAIVIEAFKNGKTFLLGVGPENFLDAFSRFRPASYNLTNLWLFRFGTSGNFYFNLITTVGILGFAAWVWLMGKIIKAKKYSAYFLTIFTVSLIFLFLPVNFLTLLIFYILVASAAIGLPKGQYVERSKILPVIILSLIVLFSGVSFYFAGRVYAAEVRFRQSLVNIALNDGTNAYNNQLKAIMLNPYNDVYRISYSQTSLALADSIAGRPDLSDQDRQTITTLIQQSISEAKVAVSLNQNKVINWENLSQTYRQLINFAEGAEQWTLTSYRQTINLDPTNPELKLGLGGVYYALGEYDEAILWFQKSIDDKANFANGYYNLSAAYKEKEDFKKAHEMMLIVTNLIPTDSVDYQKARTELEELAKNLPEEEITETTEGTTQLTEPEVLPSPIISPPIELPEQSGPEVSESTDAGEIEIIEEATPEAELEE